MSHMLEAWMILHAHHGVIRCRCGPLVALLTSFLVFIVTAASALVCKVGWSLVLVCAAILWSRSACRRGARLTLRPCLHIGIAQ